MRERHLLESRAQFQSNLRPRLEAAIEESGLSRHGFSRLIGVSESVVANMLTGNRTGYFTTLQMVSDALDKLASGEEHVETRDERLKRIREEHTLRTYQAWAEARRRRGATLHDDFEEDNLRREHSI